MLMLTDISSLIGLFKICNIRRTQHLILLYTIEMVHQMYLWDLLLIFKKISFGFALPEKIATSFNFLALLLNFFCKTVTSGVWNCYWTEPFPSFTEPLPDFTELLCESAIMPFTNATTVWTKSRPILQQLLRPVPDPHTTQKLKNPAFYYQELYIEAPTLAKTS